MESFKAKILSAHQKPKVLPGIKEVEKFVLQLMQTLFPELSEERLQTSQSLDDRLEEIRQAFENLLTKTDECRAGNIDSVCRVFIRRLEPVYDLCQLDAQAITEGDPAAINQPEVIRAYPGFFAIAVYRIAHLILDLGVPYLPRIITEYAHARTGIDIHPAAKIGKHFCIDHGTGVVIGETTEIGDYVKLYQGVTLGAISVDKELAKSKRHPTIGNRVVIYSNATILGGDTHIGDNCTVGGNAWIIKSVPPNTAIYYSHEGKQILQEIAKS